VSAEVNRLYVWLGRDQNDEQGIIQFPAGDGVGVVPLVATDLREARALRPYAEVAACLRGHRSILVEFVRAETIDTVG
jgi:hypothetical protein